MWTRPTSVQAERLATGDRGSGARHVYVHRGKLTLSPWDALKDDFARSALACFYGGQAVKG